MKVSMMIAAAAALAPVAAQAQTFDFEDASLSTVTSYSATSGGVTLDLSRVGGKSFGFSNIGSNAPGFGTRSLAPFVDYSAGAFVANFSTGLSALSVQMGDFAPSDEDTLTLSIFSGLNGTGTLLGSTSFFYGSSGFPTIATLSLASGTGFRSAVFNGGSTSFPNSVFYDNIAVRVAGGVPEPTTWALMILGFGAVGGALRRRKAATVRFA